MARTSDRHILVAFDFGLRRIGVATANRQTRTASPLTTVRVEREPSRLDLARWLVSPDNPLPARVTVNRIWQQYFGRGLVKTSENFGSQGELPSHPELLDFLARDFATHQYDLRRLLRLILMSRTYQLGETGGTAGNIDDKYFARLRPRLLSAEQLLDAVCDVTGVPEQFAGMPLGTRAIQLPDGDGQHPFLKAFGQPARELPCECERDGESNLAQALQLVSGPTLA